MEIVAREIAVEEPCFRCLIHPMGYSDRRGIQRDAFVPREDGNVSLLRARYTTEEFCMSHGRCLGGDSFRGLAVVSQSIIDSRYEQWCKAYPESVNDFEKPVIKYSPIDENNKYRSLSVEVYTTDKGLPMHADMHYPSALAVQAETKSLCRSFSKRLAIYRLQGR